MRLIDRSDFFVVTADDTARIMRFERSAEPFPSLAMVDEVFGKLLKLVRAHPAKDYAALVDSRNGPGRNDEAFERVLGQYHDPLFGPFRRCAMLLRTQVGIMQTRRIVLAHEVVVEVFQDEAKALAYLREP